MMTIIIIIIIIIIIMPAAVMIVGGSSSRYNINPMRPWHNHRRHKITATPPRSPRIPHSS